MRKTLLLTASTLIVIGFLLLPSTVLAKKNTGLTETDVMRSLDYYFSHTDSFVDVREHKTIKKSKEGRAILSLLGEPRNLKSANLVIMSDAAEVDGKNITAEATKENNLILNRFLKNVAPKCTDCAQTAETILKDGGEKLIISDGLKITISGGVALLISIETAL